MWLVTIHNLYTLWKKKLYAEEAVNTVISQFCFVSNDPILDAPATHRLLPALEQNLLLLIQLHSSLGLDLKVTLKLKFLAPYHC